MWLIGLGLRHGNDWGNREDWTRYNWMKDNTRLWGKAHILHFQFDVGPDKMIKYGSLKGPFQSGISFAIKVISAVNQNFARGKNDRRGWEDEQIIIDFKF